MHDLKWVRIIVDGVALMERECRVTKIPKGVGLIRRLISRLHRFIAKHVDLVEMHQIPLTMSDCADDYCSDPVALLYAGMVQYEGLAEFLRSGSSEQFIGEIIHTNRGNLEEMIYIEGLDGWFDDDVLRFDQVEERKSDFYKSYDPEDDPDKQEEREFLEEINPNNYKFVLIDKYIVDNKGLKVGFYKNYDYKVEFKGSMTTRDFTYYEDKPQFRKFSSDFPLSFKILVTSDNWNSNEEITERQLIGILKTKYG